MVEETLTTGFTIAWPWLLLLTPVPWLLRLLLPASSSGDLQALRVPWFSVVAGGKAGWMRRPWLALVAGLIWLLLVFAASRPQWIGEIESLPVSGLLYGIYWNSVERSPNIKSRAGGALYSMYLLE